MNKKYKKLVQCVNSFDSNINKLLTQIDKIYGYKNKTGTKEFSTSCFSK